MSNINGSLRSDGRAHRELTCQVDFGQHIVYEKAAQVLEDSFTLPAIYGLTPFGFGKFQVTFSSANYTADATANGFLFNNQRITVVPIELRSVKLTLRNCPVEIHPDVVSAALSAYGKIISHEFDKDPKRGWLTGNRTVHITMSNPVPNIVKIGIYNVIVSYPGVVLQCRRCEDTGHLASECEAAFCHKCRSYGHKAKECPRANRRRSTSRGRAPDRMQNPTRSRDPTPTRPHVTNDMPPGPSTEDTSVYTTQDKTHTSSPKLISQAKPNSEGTAPSLRPEYMPLNLSESESELLFPNPEPQLRRNKKKKKQNASPLHSPVPQSSDSFPPFPTFQPLVISTDSPVECGNSTSIPQSNIHLEKTTSPLTSPSTYAHIATSAPKSKKSSHNYSSTPVGTLSPLTKGLRNKYSKESTTVITKQLDFSGV